MDSERAIEDARSVCADLRALFEQPGGPDDPEEVERLCEIAHLVVDDSLCDRHVRDIRRYAGFLMSGDHRRWARGALRGPVLLRELVVRLLRAIDVRLETLALKGRAMRARSRARHARLNSEMVRARVRA